MRSLNLLAIVLSLGVILAGCDKQSAVMDNTDPVTGNEPSGNNPEKAELTFTKKTRPVLFEMTSTGCPGCGGWGKPTFSKLASTYGDDVTPVAVHIKYGDPMITEESQAIWDNIEGSRFTPMIFVQDENAVLVNGGSIQAESEANAKKLIGEAQQTEQAALAAHVEKTNGKWTVTYGAKFIDMMAEGTYSLSCYLTEDGIVQQQSNYANNPATHNFVIRKSASGAFGAVFQQADLTDGVISWVSEITLDNTYKTDNLYVTLVLWKKTGEHYAAVNGIIVK